MMMLACQRQLTDIWGIVVPPLYTTGSRVALILCIWESPRGVGTSYCSASVGSSSRPCPERAKRHAL